MPAPRLLLSALLLAAALPAAADIPQTHDTVCRELLAKGRLGKARPCSVNSVGSAPRPDLPDLVSLDYRIGKRRYAIEGEYDSASQSWRYRRNGRPLKVSTIRRRNGSYTCYRGSGSGICARSQNP